MEIMLSCLRSFCIATDSKILSTTNSHFSLFLFFRADGACRLIVLAGMLLRLCLIWKPPSGEMS